MSRIRIYGDSTGYVELKAPDVANNGTTEIPDSGIVGQAELDEVKNTISDLEAIALLGLQCYNYKMANQFKVLFRGSASTVSETLYTTPTATQTLVTSFVVTNTTSTSHTYTITMNNVDVAKDATVAGNDSVIIEFKQLLDATQVLAGSASAASVNFSVCGLEIS